MSVFFLTISFCSIAWTVQQTKPKAKFDYDYLVIETPVDNPKQAPAKFFETMKELKRTRLENQ